MYIPTRLQAEDSFPKFALAEISEIDKEQPCPLPSFPGTAAIHLYTRETNESRLLLQ
jgi:hypothetical protein